MDAFQCSCEVEAFFEELKSAEVMEELLEDLPDSLLAQEAASGPSTVSDTFSSTDEEELRRFLDKNINKNTSRSTASWVKRLENWKAAREIQTSLLEMNATELDSALSRFYAELRKADGTNYEPDSLRVMLAALDRHFKESGSTFSILRDKEFERSRKVLNGKAIELREGGMGKRKNKADSLSNEDEEALWDAGALGFGSPSVLNRTIWFLLSQQFGTRGVQEHTQMRVEDFKIVMHPQQNNIKYIE